MAKIEDEVSADLLASLAGMAVSEACGGPKKIAAAASIDPSNGRRWARGERSNPVYRVLGILERADDPFPLVALFAAKAARRLLEKDGPWPEWRWRAAYVEACRAEQNPDGVEDEVTVALLTGKSTVADQFAADQKVLSATAKRLALGWMGMQMGFDLAGPRAS